MVFVREWNGMDWMEITKKRRKGEETKRTEPSREDQGRLRKKKTRWVGPMSPIPSARVISGSVIHHPSVIHISFLGAAMTRMPSFLVRSLRSKPPMATVAPTPPDPDPEPSSSFPVPLTPPPPAFSKEVELRRAMAASARSAARIPLGVLFEDEWIAVVDKPAGVYCDAILAALSSSSCIASSSNSNSKLHLANRLDRDTSGLMLLTKHNKAAAGLVKSFTDHAISKTYLALSVGPAPAWRHLHITSGHGRSKHGAWRVYSLDDVGRPLPGGSRVKHMETAFEVLSIDAGAGTGTATATEVEKSVVVRTLPQDKTVTDENGRCKSDEVLLRAYPRSGRTHQIRLHCQYLGLPIRGDVKYGGVPEWNGMECGFHALHAETLSFVHPITEVPLSFKAPPPHWLQGTRLVQSGIGETES